MRIVIAEDQVLLRDGLVRLLESAGHVVVARVGDARALVEQVNAHRPDLLLADVRMPPTHTDDGARAAACLRERFPRLAVLVLSQAVEPSLVAGLANGRVTAFGYLLKDRVLDTAAFLDAVATVGAGGTVIDPTVFAGPAPGAPVALTGREAEVLGRVAAGRSNAGIAADLVISKRTVEAHLRVIVDKLGIDAGPEDNQRVLAVLTWFAGRT
ncbi:response regulator transcription factor [Pseudonocardia tropica]|uniref:Response regulator transcription factor n=1 Tax=Pseudonocardia tropica TaxID=681289 RepID=A0ABV1JX18_9PSEU